MGIAGYPPDEPSVYHGEAPADWSPPLLNANELPAVQRLEVRPAELSLGEVWGAAATIKQLYAALYRLAEAADACSPQCEDNPGEVQQRVNEAFTVLRIANR